MHQQSPQFANQVLTWYEGQPGIFYKIFSSSRSASRDAAVAFCPVQVSDKEEANNHLDSTLHSIFRYPGVFVIKTWQSEKMAGAPTSEYKFEVRKEDLNAYNRPGYYGQQQYYPSGPNSALPQNYFNNGIGGNRSIGGEWMEKFFEQKADFQQQLFEIQMGQMQETIESIQDSQKSMLEKVMEIVTNPDVAASIGAVVQSFMGNRVPISVTGTRNDVNPLPGQEPTPIIENEDVSKLINAVKKMEEKLPGANVIEMLCILSEQPAQTLQALAAMSDAQ